MDAHEFSFFFVGWWVGFMMGAFFAGFIRMRYRDKEIKSLEYRKNRWEESAMHEWRRANATELRAVAAERELEDLHHNGRP
jgi:hypothetical protein